MPLAMGGFEQEVRDALAARAERLAAEGLAYRQGAHRPAARPPRHAAAPRSRCSRRQAVSRDQTAYTPAASGETMAGTYRQRLTLTSGRFAMIDNGLVFAHVPWTPALDDRLGRHVTGVAKESGGIDWSFGRKRGLEI
jgi:hypothetical protein